MVLVLGMFVGWENGIVEDIVEFCVFGIVVGFCIGCCSFVSYGRWGLFYVGGGFMVV